MSPSTSSASTPSRLAANPARQVVERDDLVDAVGQQPAAEVGADEAGAAGDDDLHGVSLLKPARRRR